MVVVRCDDPALVGVRGILIRETDETFGIVTANSRFVSVAKNRADFCVGLGKKWRVVLKGKGLYLRSTRRANPTGRKHRSSVGRRSQGRKA